MFSFYGIREEVFITNYTDELKAIIGKDLEEAEAAEYERMDKDLVD